MWSTTDCTTKYVSLTTIDKLWFLYVSNKQKKVSTQTAFALFHKDCLSGYLAWLQTETVKPD